MVGYDVTSRVAALLSKPLRPDDPAIRSTSRLRTFESRGQFPVDYRTATEPRVYELNFECLKREILDVKQKSDAESQALASRSAAVEELRNKKVHTKEALQTSQSRLRQIHSKAACRVSRTVSTYSENKYRSLLQRLQAKVDSTAELRFNLENTRERRTDLTRKQKSVLGDIRQLQQQTPCKKQIILKHRMDMASIKDEQIRRLRSEVTKAKNVIAERENGGKSEQDCLSTEHDTLTKNLCALRNTFKSLQHDKSGEDAQWQATLGESRRKLAQFQNKRCQIAQENAGIRSELINRLDAVFGKKALTDESINCLTQKQAAQVERKKNLIAADRQLIDRSHQIFSDQQIIEPVVKRIAAKLKLQKSGLSVKISQTEVRLSQVVNVEEGGLKDFHQKLEVQSETMAKLEEVCSVTEDRISKVRKEEEKVSGEILSVTVKLTEIKHQVASLREKVHELNKWKRKLEAVGVTPQCYLRRLQERIEFVNSDLLNVHKYQILCQDPARLRPINHSGREHNASRRHPNLPGYLKDAIPSTCDPGFLETLKEAFIAADNVSQSPLQSRRCPPEDNCTAICRKYLKSSARFSDDDQSRG